MSNFDWAMTPITPERLDELIEIGESNIGKFREENINRMQVDALSALLELKSLRAANRWDDAKAIRAYYFTVYAKGFAGTAPLWHELADETKQLYRNHTAPKDSP